MLRPSQKERTSISEVAIVGIDLAKRVFHLHSRSREGSVVFRNKLSRGQVLAFISQLPRCAVAMEACATAHGSVHAMMFRTRQMFVGHPTIATLLLGPQEASQHDLQKSADSRTLTVCSTRGAGGTL